MAENKEPSKPNKNDKNLKSKFNTNWFFFILLLAFIAIQVLFSGKYSKKASSLTGTFITSSRYMLTVA